MATQPSPAKSKVLVDAASSPANEKTSRKDRLLIVDDEPDIREILAQLLTAPDREITTCSDGQEAVEKITLGWFDTIISDIAMPRLDGLGFLKRIAAMDIVTPFILLTAHGDREAAIQALRLGAYDFLDKPFDAVDLSKKVAQSLKLGRELQRLESEMAHEDQVGLSEEEAKRTARLRRALLKMRLESK